MMNQENLSLSKWAIHKDSRILMPSLCTQMSSCNLYAWSVDVGQEFKAGDKLLKATYLDNIYTIYSQEDGTIQKIYHRVGQKILLHETIGITKNRSLDQSLSEAQAKRNNSDLVDRMIYRKGSNLIMGVDCRLYAWSFSVGEYFKAGDKLLMITWNDKIIPLFASEDGKIQRICHGPGSIISKNEIVAAIRFSQPPKTSESSLCADNSQDYLASNSLTTSSSIQSGDIQIQRGQLPIFIPSLASVPIGFRSQGGLEADLEYAVSNPAISFQSFFNDCNILTTKGINDDILNLPCFDEDLYSRLAKEMHRYTLSEIADQRESLAKENAKLGTFVGSLLGVLFQSPLAPFVGRNFGRQEVDRGKRIEEFLPDPHLLFYQDDNSFLSWSRGQALIARLRRLMIIPMETENGNIYFRLLPAIVTQDSVYPIQLFKIGGSSFFYRPFASGIERDQEYYDAVKVQRRYTHIRVEGTTSKMNLRLPVFGSDIEEFKTPIYAFSGQGLDYLYADFKKLPGSVF